MAKQRFNNDNVKLDVKASYIGSKIFEADHLYKSFGDLKILDDFSYIFSRYEKMGIVGNNGTGKSTFIKILMGLEQADSGMLDIGETVRFGYYSQDGLQFDEQMKVIDVVQDIAEVIELGNLGFSILEFGILIWQDVNLIQKDIFVLIQLYLFRPASCGRRCLCSGGNQW